MGTYKFSKEVYALVFERIEENEFDSVLSSAAKYVDIENKTVDEVLDSLYEYSDSKEDEKGAVYRHLKYTGGKTRLSERAENVLVEAQLLSWVIYNVQKLKSWLNDEDNDD